jgi:hypothetical protein
VPAPTSLSRLPALRPCMPSHAALPGLASACRCSLHRHTHTSTGETWTFMQRSRTPLSFVDPEQAGLARTVLHRSHFLTTSSAARRSLALARRQLNLSDPATQGKLWSIMH